MRVDELEDHLRVSLAAQPAVVDRHAEIVRRVRRHQVRRRAGVTLIAAASVVSVVVAWSPWTSPHQRLTATGPIATLPETRLGPTAVVHGVTVHLAKRVGTELPGTGFAPGAVATTSGDRVFYTADGTTGPEIRVLDVASGRDELLIPDAYSPAVNVAATRLAYGHALYSDNRRTSDLHVRDLTTGADKSLGSYAGIIQPMVWAGDTLVSQHLQESLQPSLDVELTQLDGTNLELPGYFKAVSEDGALLLVTGPVDRILQIINARTGESLGAMTIGQFIDGYIPPDRAATIPHDRFPTEDEGSLPVALTDNPGIWIGSEIVLPANPTPILIKVEGMTPVPDGLLALPEHTDYIATVEPGAIGHVVFPMHGPLSSRRLDCEVMTRSCSAGPFEDSLSVWNPSR